MAHGVWVVRELDAIYIPTSRASKVHINAISNTIAVAVKSGARPITAYHTGVSNATMCGVYSLTSWHCAGVVILTPVRSYTGYCMGY